MSELAVGGTIVGGTTAPDGWGFVHPGGVRWIGNQAAEEKDIAAIKEFYRKGFYFSAPMGVVVEVPAGSSPVIAEDSLVGRYDPHYTVFGKPSKDGGLGSRTYERQFLAPQHERYWLPTAKTRKKGLWYRSLAGEMLKGIPNGSLYDKVDDVNYELLADAASGYYFDHDFGLYRPY